MLLGHTTVLCKEICVLTRSAVISPSQSCHKRLNTACRPVGSCPHMARRVRKESRISRISQAGSTDTCPLATARESRIRNGNVELGSLATLRRSIRLENCLACSQRLPPSTKSRKSAWYSLSSCTTSIGVFPSHRLFKVEYTSDLRRFGSCIRPKGKKYSSK